MPGLITDLLGKASIDTDHSVATTVTADRTAGVTVLSAFDLSTYTEDTAVFFVTYTKTIDPLTSAVSITDVTSWKGLVNAGANTITNLTVAPGYVDAGNITGQFIECIPTSYWENSLIDMLLTEHKQLGGHKDITADSVTSTGAIEASEFIITGSGGDNGWQVGLPAQSGTIVNNGNRSVDVPFASTVADLLTPGMKVRIPRTVPAATQCTDLEDGSSQYASRTSGSLTGVTFTTTFSCEAWIKPESYTSEIVVGRTLSTGGFDMRLDNTGKLTVLAGTASAFDLATSYQSVDLDKWVHVAVTLNIATGTATLYINGASIPFSYTASAAASITQGGNLVIGRRDHLADQYFDGKIQDVRIWSDIRTAAEIRDNMYQYPADTTGLVAHYKLDGDFNDSSANANHLTAQNGATATNADAPFGVDANGVTGDYEYGLVTKVVTTTATIQIPEGCGIPTYGGVGSIGYSTQAAPYGFPTNKGRWEITTMIHSQASKSAAVASTWYNLCAGNITDGFYLTVPVGEWYMGYTAAIQCNGGTSILATQSTLSTANNTAGDRKWSGYNEASSIASSACQVSIYDYETVTAQTIYYMNTRMYTGGTGSTIYNRGELGVSMIKAIPAYL